MSVSSLFVENNDTIYCKTLNASLLNINELITNIVNTGELILPKDNPSPNGIANNSIIYTNNSNILSTNVNNTGEQEILISQTQQVISNKVLASSVINNQVPLFLGQPRTITSNYNLTVNDCLGGMIFINAANINVTLPTALSLYNAIGNPTITSLPICWNLNVNIAGGAYCTVITNTGIDFSNFNSSFGGVGSGGFTKVLMFVVISSSDIAVWG